MSGAWKQFFKFPKLLKKPVKHYRQRRQEAPRGLLRRCEPWQHKRERIKTGRSLETTKGAWKQFSKFPKLLEKPIEYRQGK